MLGREIDAGIRFQAITLLPANPVEECLDRAEQVARLRRRRTALPFRRTATLVPSCRLDAERSEHLGRAGFLHALDHVFDVILRDRRDRPLTPQRNQHALEITLYVFCLTLARPFGVEANDVACDVVCRTGRDRVFLVPHMLARDALFLDARILALPDQLDPTPCFRAAIGELTAVDVAGFAPGVMRSSGEAPGEDVGSLLFVGHPDPEAGDDGVPEILAPTRLAVLGSSNNFE